MASVIDTPWSFDLAGKVILVTGAASGLGEAIARATAAKGARLALFDIDGAALAAVVEGLNGEGFETVGYEVDIQDRGSLEVAIDTAAERFGGLDVVFANAGIGGGPGYKNPDGSRNAAGEIENISDELWDRVLAINLTAVFTTVRRAAAHMKRLAKGGKIVVTTSVASFSPAPWVGTPYFPAKAGAAHLVRQMALELAPFQITVNAIAPGAFSTNIGGGRLKNEEVARAMGKRIPLGRVAQPREIGGLAVFLASSASSFVTGVEIPIDGGSSLGAN